MHGQNLSSRPSLARVLWEDLPRFLIKSLLAGVRRLFGLVCVVCACAVAYIEHLQALPGVRVLVMSGRNKTKTCVSFHRASQTRPQRRQWASRVATPRRECFHMRLFDTI